MNIFDIIWTFLPHSHTGSFEGCREVKKKLLEGFLELWFHPTPLLSSSPNIERIIEKMFGVQTSQFFPICFLYRIKTLSRPDPLTSSSTSMQDTRGSGYTIGWRLQTQCSLCSTTILHTQVLLFRAGSLHSTLLEAAVDSIPICIHFAWQSASIH